MILPFKSYAAISLSVQQSVNLGVGNHLEYDTLTIVGSAITAGVDVSLSTGAGQANGRITLANRRYLLVREMWARILQGRLLIEPLEFDNATYALNEAGDALPWHQLIDDSVGDFSPQVGVFDIIDATGGGYELQSYINTSLNVSWINSRIFLFPLGAVT